MITLEVNRQSLTDAILSMDGAGIAEFAENLQWLLEHPDDDLMFTPDSWGMWDGTLSQRALFGNPYSVVSFLRIFHDRPEKNALEGLPVACCVDETGYELDRIATESTLHAMAADLATLQQEGDCCLWEIESASAVQPQNQSRRPLPPVRIRIQRSEEAERRSSLPTD